MEPGNDAERTEPHGAAAHNARPAAEPPLTRRELRAREAAMQEAAEQSEQPSVESAPSAGLYGARPPAGNNRPDGDEATHAPGSAPITGPDMRTAATSSAAQPEPAVGDSRSWLHPDLHALFGHAQGEEPEQAAATPAEARKPDVFPFVHDDAERSPGPDRTREPKRGRGRSGTGRRRPRVGLIVGLVLLLIVVGGGVGAYAVAAPKVQSIISMFSGHNTADADYNGDGTGTVTITIKEGDIGSDIATTLHKDGVTASYGAFYKLLLAAQNVQFQPGSYTLKHHMSAKAALAALQNPANRVDNSIVIPEGTVLKTIEASLVQKAGLSQSAVTAAANNISAYGLPAGVQSLEGWLFPATYPVNPGWTAQQYFQAMVQTMKTHLDQAGVAPADREHVIIFASLVQKEAGQEADFPKVARVFQNRLNANMYLQSDATVAYGTGNTDRVTTTDAERNDASNPYNTYKHLGLPPGPISNPGDVAIDAVLHPADGSWLYFVTVNLQTGETVFSDTLAEHEQAVAQFQAWLRAHPSYQ